MNTRGVIVLALAVLCGLGSMVGVRKLLSNQKAAGGPRKDVLVVTAPIMVEELVTDQKVALKSIPAELVPAGALADFKLARGRWAKYPLMEGDVVLDSKLAAKGQPTGLMGKLQPGMRAFTIRVDEQSGISGFILPDYRVDILKTVADRDPGRAELLLGNVRVLAAGRVIENPEDRAIESETVTVEVTPSQAERLAAATKTGTLILTLRPLGRPDDPSMPEEPAPAEIPQPETKAVASLPDKIHAGMRAVTIPIDEKTGNPGHVFPDHHVDILKSDPADKQAPVYPVLKDVRVLAVGQAIENPDGQVIESNTVTVEVTPPQARALMTAMNSGQLSIALRPASESGISAIPTEPTPDELPPAPPAPVLTGAPQPPPRRVTVFAGRHQIHRPNAQSAGSPPPWGEPPGTRAPFRIDSPTDLGYFPGSP